MSAIIQSRVKRKSNILKSFIEKDLGMSIKLCKARTPETKGK
jgi:hypothetical protein